MPATAHPALRTSIDPREAELADRRRRLLLVLFGSAPEDVDRVFEPRREPR